MAYLEHAPTAHAEQGVAAEQMTARAVVGHMAAGMPGNDQYRELPAIELEPGAFADALRGLGDALILRGEDRQGGPALQ